MSRVSVIVAYVPVLHEGYRRFFAAHPEARILVLGRDITQRFRPLVKDLRALEPELVARAIASWRLGGPVGVATPDDLVHLATSGADIIMPDEDISHDLAQKYFGGAPVQYDPIFLRWDRRRSEAKAAPEPSRKISASELDRELMLQAHAEGQRSSDIWRQVGTLVARDGRVLLADHNQSLPTANTAWADGDPRNNFGQGVAIETSIFIHAEAALIAQAAKNGIALKGASMYINTFPCPVCAKLIASSGIKTVYYAQGYAMLDGQQVLDAAGVEPVYVEADLPPAPEGTRIPYPEK